MNMRRRRFIIGTLISIILNNIRKVLENTIVYDYVIRKNDTEINSNMVK